MWLILGNRICINCNCQYKRFICLIYFHIINIYLSGTNWLAFAFKSIKLGNVNDKRYITRHFYFYLIKTFFKLTLAIKSIGIDHDKMKNFLFSNFNCLIFQLNTFLTVHVFIFSTFHIFKLSTFQLFQLFNFSTFQLSTFQPFHHLASCQ